MQYQLYAGNLLWHAICATGKSKCNFIVGLFNCSWTKSVIEKINRVRSMSIDQTTHTQSHTKPHRNWTEFRLLWFRLIQFSINILFSLFRRLSENVISNRGSKTVHSNRMTESGLKMISILNVYRNVPVEFNFSENFCEHSNKHFEHRFE